MTPVEAPRYRRGRIFSAALFTPGRASRDIDTICRIRIFGRKYEHERRTKLKGARAARLMSSVFAHTASAGHGRASAGRQA